MILVKIVVIILCDQAKLPEQFDLDIVRKGLGEVKPTGVVLLQELERFNRLITKMDSSLKNLQRVREIHSQSMEFHRPIIPFLRHWQERLG